MQINPALSFGEVCLVEIRLLDSGDLNRLRFISEKNYSHKCYVGDFNYRDIKWESWSTHHNEDSKEKKSIERIRDCYLHQRLLLPTRRRGNDEPSLIGLLLTGEIMQVSDITHHAPQVMTA